MGRTHKKIILESDNELMSRLQLVSFDPLRVWDIPGVFRVKPEEWSLAADTIRQADWLLFPEYWQVSIFAYGWRKRIFPSLSSYYLGHSKVEMTYAFQAVCPDNVPYTRILFNTETAVEAILDEFSFPFVAKEVRSARGYGVSLIENRRELSEYVAKNSVLYIQKWLPIDRDLRVVVVGQEIVTAYWRIGPAGGFHNNVARGGEISFENIPDPALDLVQRVASELEIDHAGFDIALVEGHPYLLEFNMLFGNEALRLQNIRLGPRIVAYLQQALDLGPTGALPQSISLGPFSNGV